MLALSVSPTLPQNGFVDIPNVLKQHITTGCFIPIIAVGAISSWHLATLVEIKVKLNNLEN